MNATDAAAWWGAVAASIGIVWDIFKWGRSGPAVNVMPAPNMQLMGGLLGKVEKGKTFLFVEVTNTGDQPTTITHLVFQYFPSWWQDWLHKPERVFAVMNPAHASAQLPHLLPTGGRWSGSAGQDGEIEALAKSGRLYVGVYHTFAKKPVLARVFIRPSLPEKAA